MKKNSLKKIIPLLFGLFLVYYSFKNTSLENRLDILNSIFKADYKFVLLSIFFGVLSHLSRAFRWKYLLKPLGYKINGLNSVMSVFSCFLSNKLKSFKSPFFDLNLFSLKFLLALTKIIMLKYLIKLLSISNGIS